MNCVRIEVGCVHSKLGTIKLLYITVEVIYFTYKLLCWFTIVEIFSVCVSYCNKSGQFGTINPVLESRNELHPISFI